MFPIFTMKYDWFPNCLYTKYPCFYALQEPPSLSYDFKHQLTNLFLMVNEKGEFEDFPFLIEIL